MADFPGKTLGTSLIPLAGLPREGDLIAGKYRVQGTLGAGGMGIVLLARHEAIGQLVAVKFLVINDEQFRPEATTRLLREARASANLKSEHTVRVYDVGEHHDGTAFIVMERLEGHDLAVVLKRVGRLPVGAAVALILQACEAVAEAHRAGIVHRDLKPSNLFLVRRPDGKAMVKVLDFGISKSMSPDPAEPQTLTGERVALGSPHYMSPEQVRDARSVDGRTDIWSLGVILYELVAGRPAFQATTYPGVYAAIAADSPPPLSSLQPEVQAELEQVIDGCLQRKADQRFQSVEELVLALEPFAAQRVDFDVLLSSNSTEGPEISTSSGERAAFPETQRAAEHREIPGTEPLPVHTQVSQREGTVGPGRPPRVAPAVVGLPRAVHEPETQRSPSEAPPEEKKPSRVRLIWVALALVALGSGALRWFWRHQPPDEKVERARSVTINVDSTPRGARVREGARDYGVTPLRLTLSTAGSSAKTRVLLLELAGYRPYVIEQDLSQGVAVSVHADLVRDTPSAALKDQANSMVPVPARSVSTPRPPQTRSRPQTSATPGPDDIRLER